MRGWWKKSCHCGLHLSTNAGVNILASETGTKCSNQSEGSVRALNQLHFKLVKGLDKRIVNVMSNCLNLPDVLGTSWQVNVSQTCLCTLPKRGHHRDVVDIFGS